MMKFRTEKDTLGEVKVPVDAYYGAQTQRAVENFKVSGLHLQPVFIKTQAIIKRAAAIANTKSGRLDRKIGEAIVKAADEIIAGKFNDQFVVDVFQAGAGTSQNMNINEVISNRANEILGGKLGENKPVNPNDHANMSQSTNDTIHTAIHISAYTEIHRRLLPVVKQLKEALYKKADEFDNVIKAGRTHLQDAVPIRLGQEFSAYARMIENDYNRILHSGNSLLELCIGGTAVGTGISTDPDYKKNVIEQINQTTGFDFKPAENPFEAMQSLDAVVEVAGALRVLVTGLMKIADDFRLLSSGPRTGLAEIRLPAVQPGSSIIPGKVNPVMAEMLNMVCFQAMGCDTAIVRASQAGQLELNVMMPVIAYNLLFEIQILTGGIENFVDKCVIGIKADADICRHYAENSPAIATALNPHIGYYKAAELAKEALEKDVTIRELAIAKKIIDKDKLDNVLDIRKMTKPPASDR